MLSDRRPRVSPDQTITNDTRAALGKEQSALGAPCFGASFHLLFTASGMFGFCVWSILTSRASEFSLPHISISWRSDNADNARFLATPRWDAPVLPAAFSPPVSEIESAATSSVVLVPPPPPPSSERLVEQRGPGSFESSESPPHELSTELIFNHTLTTTASLPVTFSPTPPPPPCPSAPLSIAQKTVAPTAPLPLPAKPPPTSPTSSREALVTGSSGAEDAGATEAAEIPLNRECLGRSCNGTCNRELGRCDYGWKVEDPELPRKWESCTGFRVKTETCSLLPKGQARGYVFSQFCWADCNDRGKCKMGFCHCAPGFWGADCSLSTRHSEAQAPSQPDSHASLRSPGKLSPTEVALWEDRGPGDEARPRPWIYVYDMPPFFHLESRQKTGIRLDTSRPESYMLAERMLSTVHRVADPAEADYFYVPVMGSRFYRGHAPGYVREAWPEIFSVHARRHLFAPASDDMGYSNANDITCDGEGEGQCLLPDWLNEAGFLDLKGISPLSSFRNDLDFRVPPALFIGGDSPAGPLMNYNFAKLTRKAKAAWRRRGSETDSEMENQILFYFAGSIAALCGPNVTQTKDCNCKCYNESNIRAQGRQKNRAADSHGRNS
ncbi:hypothetical protein CYMTET_54952 [Cymbomonas tetramitiformis]|uniref:EGF-like domain-containing protein n=1 Tax=Cymbomonas tetramitiformis TaxID=36881 RepID=A0AAE0BDX2_9CHLO|nr:hypothetical protein CYMTET_54952 [Cymbomonas tetramitiformis]